jgi:hypothetical protein
MLGMRKLSYAVLVGAYFLVIVDAKKKGGTSMKTKITNKHMSMCSGLKPLASKKEARILSWLMEASGENSVLMKSSAQHQAACWILHMDRKKSLKRSRDLLLQRYALATLHFTTTQSNSTVWDWPMAGDLSIAGQKAKGNWMSAHHHECQWYGVQCNWKTRVIALDLGFMKLDGLIPREIALLPHLEDIDMHGNDLQGVLPYKMLSSLSKLKYLRLHMNGFFGTLYGQISGLVSLKQLHIFGNYIAGSIPTELATLSNLEVIDLYANQLEGRIPSELGRLKKLRYLDVHDNNLVGTMPREICDLKLNELVSDCLGPAPEVQCDCCTICCRGLPDLKCVRVDTGKEVRYV